MVAPVDHRYAELVAEQSCVEKPVQKLPPVIEQDGTPDTVSVLLQLLVQPKTFVTVTV